MYGTWAYQWTGCGRDWILSCVRDSFDFYWHLLLSLQKKLTVRDASLSLKRYVEELQQKYESKVAQGSGCGLKDLTLIREDNIDSAWIPKEEVGEEMKATADGTASSIQHKLFYL